jgi:hypothetical protein
LGVAFRARRGPLTVSRSTTRRRSRVMCAKCGARGCHIDVRPNWKEQSPRRSLTGKEWRRAKHLDCNRRGAEQCCTHTLDVLLLFSR